MKKLCCLVAFAIISAPSHATVYTLCNMAYCQASPGFVYTTFDDVQNAASDGDIIYVQGSSINYGSISINKRLTLIGAGYHPNKQNALTSSFIHIDINNTNVQLLGLTFSHMTIGGNSCVVKKCSLTGEPGWTLLTLYSPAGCLIEGNIFSSADPYSPCIATGSNANNLIIENNIFSSPGPKIYGINNNPSERAYILNNVYLGFSISYPTLGQMRFVNIENNIFVGASSPDDNSNLNCVMNNNISYACNDNTFHSPGINNLVNTDPQFVNLPGPNSLFDFTYDFSLAATSPGHNSGTDGTDRGVFGGIGFKFTMAGEPAISEVTALSITSGTTVSPGGNITISLTSKSVH